MTACCNPDCRRPFEPVRLLTQTGWDARTRLCPECRADYLAARDVVYAQIQDQRDAACREVGHKPAIPGPYAPYCLRHKDRRPPPQTQTDPTYLRINLGNLLELVGSGLLIYGIYVLAGWGACVITGAFCAVVMAEYLYGDTVFRIPINRGNRLPQLPEQPRE